VLADMPITLCKIGLLGSLEIIEAVCQLLREHPKLPVILDPILAAGGGHALADVNIRHTIVNQLLPLTTVLTPNSQEARRLSGKADLETAAAWLMDKGCEYVCITGTHEEIPNVVNTLYGQGQFIQSWSWPRFADSFHGSGCTFASSLAGFLAQGQEITEAVYTAQQYTWHSLRQGFCPGQGQAFPNRLCAFNPLNSYMLK
jgi:hydroxymethylpyrimidine/phosphomethylpyrimidine kinase